MITLSPDSIKPGVLTDNATGDTATDVIYDDLNVEQIESLPDSQLHRNVDLELLRADKEGTFKLSRRA